MNKILNIILVFILTTSGLVAQENLTLFKAVKNTLENNLDIKISENLQEIAKNNSSILNNNYLPNIQLGSDINTNVQNIEIETPSGIAGALDNTQTDNSSAVLSINYNLIDASGRKYNFKKSKELFSKSKLEVKEIIENTLLQLFTVYFEVGRLTEEEKILKNALDISRRRYQRKLSQYEFGQTNNLEILNAPNPKDGIGAEILYEIIENKTSKKMHLDLLDCNDLLPALSAYLALGPGGRIINASHARHKESNRISKTVEVLSHFGLLVEECEDGIQTQGNQIPKMPENIVNVYADHRLFMTAACIASKTGGKLTDRGIWRVTDPLFPEQIGFD